MATILEVYKLLKLKKENGENIGMFGESFIEMCEKDEESSKTKEISVTLIKNKDKSLYFPKKRWLLWLIINHMVN